MGYTGGVKREREEEEDGASMVESQRRSNPRLAPPPLEWPASVLEPSDDWIEFRHAVHYEFAVAGKLSKNQDFLAVIRGLSHGLYGVEGVVSYLQPLFQGYPDLIRKFNTFLPRGYELRDNQGGGADA